LNAIGVTDTLCDPSGDNSCWGNYKKIFLDLPSEIGSFDPLFESKLDLVRDIKSIVWYPLKCSKPGVYTIKVRFDNGKCEKTLVLNLTESQEQKKAKTQANEDLEEQSISEISSIDSYNKGDSTNSVVAQTSKPSRSDVVVLAKDQVEFVNNEKNYGSSKIYLFIGIILFLFVFILLLVLFFIKRRKKIDPQIIKYY
jgi:hypothetical protein